MKRFPIAFFAVLTLTTGILFAVDESPVAQLVQAVRVWVINSEVAEDSDPIVAVVKSGNVGTYEVVGFKPRGGGKPETWRVVISKSDEPQPPTPGPTPTPNPSLQGFALEVYKQAATLPASDCKRLAGNYETVASMIAAGGIRDTSAANAKLTELNKSLSLSPAIWSTFAAWLGKQYNDQAQTLEASRKLMLETAQGLHAVGAR